MTENKKLKQIEFDMLPGNERQIVLPDVLLLDDNLDGKSDNEIAAEDLDIVKLMFPMVVFCCDGEVKLRMNLEDYTLVKGNVLVIPNGTMIGGYLHIKKGSRMAIMAFPEEVLPLLAEVSNYTRTGSTVLHPFVMALPDNINDMFIKVYLLMRSTMEAETITNKKEILLHYISILAYYSRAYKDKVMIKQTQSSGEKLFGRFIDDVRVHCVEERQLSFYANKLCVTPKYLSRVIIQQSGRRPFEWIRDYVILEAKAMLASGQYTVQQVGVLLNFPNPSFFGKYFKLSVGCSPRQYQMNRGHEDNSKSE